MHTALFINLFNKGLAKNIHKKTQSLHTTPKDPTMDKYHVNGALCPENYEIPPSARNQKYIAYP
jgi:cell division protein YceG involved in septum cleavage